MCTLQLSYVISFVLFTLTTFRYFVVTSYLGPQVL